MADENIWPEVSSGADRGADLSRCPDVLGDAHPRRHAGEFALAGRRWNSTAGAGLLHCSILSERSFYGRTPVGENRGPAPGIYHSQYWRRHPGGARAISALTFVISPDDRLHRGGNRLPFRAPGAHSAMGGA